MTLLTQKTSALRGSLCLILALTPACVTSPELTELVMLHREGAHEAALTLLEEEDVQREEKFYQILFIMICLLQSLLIM